ncbi:MAG TPA: hypothetical protein VHM26_07960 [Chitinophagaceae bacterium]|jgi:uncharacterized protein with PQ loop repeat|nr:hypothetical protein [Chitinophagaceae bacterium]
MEGVFSIRLNKEGIATARFITRLFAIMSILTFIGLALITVRNVFVYKAYMKIADTMELQHGSLAGMYFRVIPIGFFLTTLVNVIASCFTLKFSLQLSKSLRTMDEDHFSNSFRGLAIAGVCWLFSTILQIIIYCVVLINQFENKI